MLRVLHSVLDCVSEYSHSNFHSQVNIVFMAIALLTVYKTKRRSVQRRKSVKSADSSDKAKLDLFKYDIVF